MEAFLGITVSSGVFACRWVSRSARYSHEAWWASGQQQRIGIADYLQKFVDAYGILDATTLERMNEIATVGSEISSVVDGELGGD